jgi:type II secretory pathway pseudopilin PulG
MSPRTRRGFMLVLATLLLLACACAIVSFELASRGAAARRETASDHAIAQAREALIAYAADRPINASVGPGYLPCPDLDDDGWAESTCGSMSGESGQESRLGRLPWKTLGLPDLRDGHGERLWYAVSSKHKGLLNCGASRACLDMSPDAAIGTITVRDSSGTVIHDGTSTDLYAVDRAGALAVVFAPGPPLNQRRECAPGECDARDAVSPIRPRAPRSATRRITWRRTTRISSTATTRGPRRATRTDSSTGRCMGQTARSS